MIQETLDNFPLNLWHGGAVVVVKFSDEIVRALCNECGAWLGDWNEDHWDSSGFVRRPRLPDGSRGFEVDIMIGFPKECLNCLNYIGGDWE